jgi:hypothetical protein
LEAYPAAEACRVAEGAARQESVAARARTEAEIFGKQQQEVVATEREWGLAEEQVGLVVLAE